MKITLLTPGTGHFYCGSCLRDSALAKALRARGHDVFVVPLYLPFMLEDDAPHPAQEESPRIFLGGVNMYLQQKAPWLAKLPRWIRRPLDSPGLLRWLSRFGDMTQAEDLGAMIVSTLRGDHGRQRAEVERLVEWLAGEERPDAILLSNAMLLGLAHRLRDVLHVPLYCTFQGEQPFLDTLREPYLSQAWEALRERAGAVEGFVGVSRYYGALMAERLGVPPERWSVVYNGIDLGGLEPDASRRTGDPAQPDPPVLGYLARMCEDKGLPVLVDAFCRLKPDHPDLRLCVVGVMLKEDEALVARCKAKLRAAGVLEHASFHPNVSREEKLRLLAGFSLFSVPATYGESFGLYLLEAWAFGLPVVQPDHAAFPELIEETGAGLLCAPDDPQALAGALGELLADPARMRALGERGRAAVEGRFTVDRMAADVEAVLAPVPATGSATRP